MAYAAAESFDPGGPPASAPASPATMPSARRSPNMPTRTRAAGSRRGTRRRRRRSGAARSSRSGSGGVLVTAGNLVFQGDDRHHLRRLPRRHRRQGAGTCRSSKCRSPRRSPTPVDGEEYIAVNAGWGGGLAHVERANYSQLFLSEAAPVGVQARRHRRSCRRCPRPRSRCPSCPPPPKLDRLARDGGAGRGSSTAPTARCATGSARAAGSRTCGT